MSLFTNDLDTVQECFGWGVMMFFDTLLMGTLAVGNMWRMDRMLTLLSMIPMALLLAAATVIGRQMMIKWDIRQEAFSRLSDFSQESFSGIAVIKAFVKEAVELMAFRKLNEENEEANIAHTRYSVLLRILVMLFVESVVCIILGYGGYLVYKGRFNAGQLVEFIGYFNAVVWPIMAVSELIDMTSRGKASLNRLEELLDAEVTVADREGAKELKNVRGDIEFRHLSFRYPGSETEVLKDISVAIQAGENIGLVGNSGKYFAEQQRNLGAVNGYIEEMIQGQKVIKVFCHEEVVKKEFGQLNERLFVSADRANTFANILGPINAQLGNISYVICAIAGGVLALNHIGGFTLGGLASFLTFNKSFSMPINQVSMQLNAVVMALAGAERIFRLLDEKPEEDDGYVTLVNVREENGQFTESQERTGRWAWKHVHQADGSVDYVELKGDVVFNGVDFGYNDDKIVLHDVKLYAEPGQKIAFVGSTGAGKTTITNLINRFYDIQDGKIRYDGININKIKKADLRRSLGIVLQDTHLFTGTVRENIRFGKLNATDTEVYEAARLANADGFIRRLPQGYDTMLTGDGANLSQGQRQLLAIARAAIADPPVLILDEATSSIDTRTEQIVQKGMDRLMRGRTTFVIAHRLSTVRNSDCIMVLEQGRIVERGTHEQLMEEQGRYYQLYTGNAIHV